MANTFDIYFGTVSGNLDLISFDQADTTLSLDANSLAYNTTYYWRVDSVDELANVTTGDEWSFTTEAFTFPTPTEEGAATPNMMAILRKLVVAADNKVYYET